MTTSLSLSALTSFSVLRLWTGQWMPARAFSLARLYLAQRAPSERSFKMPPSARSVRRRPEEVVAKTFERVGENVEMDGQKAYRASLLDLLAVANIERPISEEYMRDILSGGAYPEFLTDESEEDYFFYVPAE